MKKLKLKKRRRSPRSLREIISDILVRLPLLFYVVTIVIPFVFMLMNSLKTNKEFYANFWNLPAEPQWSNYTFGLQHSGILDMFLNTIFIVAGAEVLNIFSASMLAYVIARGKLKRSGLLYGYLMVGLLTPGVICMIPVFFVALVLRLYDTRSILVLVYAAFNMAFSVFVMVAFFKSLPTELEEAAFIDGAGYSQTFWRVMFPLTKPGLITIGVFGFLDYWNDYLLAMTLISTEAKKTVFLGVMKMQVANAVRTDWGPLMAVCIFAMLPVLIVYAIFQSRLMEGLTSGAIKG
ncbi:MAG: carbohydrate ABC transporter permease [Clostridiaceae bacterium]|nr:carbohydrate ABC transporter permease [Clostridiaceae bacterium]